VPADREDRLEAAKAHIEEGGAEPVLCDTGGLSVYLVAALAAGQGVDATLKDHPGLTRGQAEATIRHALAHSKTGRPYPGRSFKRMLSELADLGAFGPAEDEGEAAP